MANLDSGYAKVSIRRCRLGFTITVIFRISSGRSIIKRSFFAHHSTEGKKSGFYIPKRDKRVHEHEISTHYVGELIQHDSSYHLWFSYVDQKWYLITGLDDYSRYMLYASLFERESSWRHIMALESLYAVYGFPLAYYVDNHLIFRFVETRDSVWKKHHLETDEVDPQWKMVVRECRIKALYALSPQAKGKIERPYRWLQDRIVRTCARENVTTIEQTREILGYEARRYNEHQVHSTTGEIPAVRFEKAIKEGQTLFWSFKLPVPYQSTKDLFSLREKRTADAYRKVSFGKTEFKVPGVNPYDEVELHMIPNEQTGLTGIRFWHKGKLAEIQNIKNADLKRVQF